MSTSEAINEIVTALSKAQAEMQNAKASETNPAFKSKYADLAAIRDATIPALTKHGLSLFQMTSLNGEGMTLVTRLAHSSGQWLESQYPLPVVDRPHIMGSAITYARRYSWAALVGIAAEEDDDGNDAQNAAKNGTKSLPALPARKSSAQAKRDQDWPRFEQALRDCQSAREVDRLHAEYQQGVYPAWNQDWQATAEQEFGKRLAEFSQGEDLKRTLQDSIEEDNPTRRDQWLRDQMIEHIQTMSTEADLLMWKESAAFRSDMDALPKPMQLAVRKAGATKLETLQKAAR